MRGARLPRPAVAPGRVPFSTCRHGPLQRNRLDLFPGTDPDAPCLVFIHGGYWQMNSKESFACLGDGVRAHGWSVALPGYTLAPEASLSAIVAEIARALDTLAAECAARGIRGPLIVSGWSAGGHLAALALEHEAVAAGLGISGIYELMPLRDTYLNEKLRLSTVEIETLSPLRRPAVRKRFTVAYGTEELPALVLNGRALHAHRSGQGAPGELLPSPGRNHFTILEELREADGQLTEVLLRSLDLPAA